MKKLLILIFALVLLLSFCIGAQAEEIIPGEEPVTEGEVIPEENPGENIEEPPTVEPEENPTEEPDLPPEEEGVGGVVITTVFTRLLEWWGAYKVEIQTVAGLIVTAIFTGFGKYLANKITSLGKDTAKKIDERSNASDDKTNELVDAYNKIIKAFENSNKKSVRIYNCFNYVVKVRDTDLPAIIEKHQEIEKELNKINKAINANNNTNNI